MLLRSLVRPKFVRNGVRRRLAAASLAGVALWAVGCGAESTVVGESADGDAAEPGLLSRMVDGARAGVGAGPSAADKTPQEWADARVAAFREMTEKVNERSRHAEFPFDPEVPRLSGATLILQGVDDGPIPGVSFLIEPALREARAESATGAYSRTSKPVGPDLVVHITPMEDPRGVVESMPFLSVVAEDGPARVVTARLDPETLLAALAPRAGFSDIALAGMGPANLNGREGGLVGLRFNSLLNIYKNDAGRNEAAAQQEFAEGLRRTVFNLGPDGDPQTDDTNAPGWTVGWGALSDPTRDHGWTAEEDRWLRSHEEDREFDVTATLLLAGPVPDAERWAANLRRVPGLNINSDQTPPILKAGTAHDLPESMFLHEALPPAEPHDANAIAYEQRREERDAIILRIDQEAEAAKAAGRSGRRSAGSGSSEASGAGSSGGDADDSLRDPAAGESGTEWAVRVLGDAGEEDWVAVKRAYEHLEEADPALAAPEERDAVRRALAARLPDALEEGGFTADRSALALFRWAERPGSFRAVGEAAVEGTPFGQRDLLAQLDTANPNHAHVAAPMMTTRSRGAEALAFIRKMGAPAEPAVIALLDDPNPATRRDVAALLTEIGGEAAAEALRKRASAETDRDLARHMRARRLEILKKLR